MKGAKRLAGSDTFLGLGAERTTVVLEKSQVSKKEKTAVGRSLFRPGKRERKKERKKKKSAMDSVEDRRDGQKRGGGLLDQRGRLVRGKGGAEFRMRQKKNPKKNDGG